MNRCKENATASIFLFSFMQPLTFHGLNSPGAPAFYKHIISSWTQYTLTLNTCVASIFVPRPYLMLHPLWQLSSIMLHENLMRGHDDCPLLLTLKNILLCLECRLSVILTQRCPAPYSSCCVRNNIGQPGHVITKGKGIIQGCAPFRAELRMPLKFLNDSWIWIVSSEQDAKFKVNRKWIEIQRNSLTVI